MNYTTSLSLTALLLISACRKELDEPPLPELAEDGQIFVSAILKRVPDPGNHFRFNSGDSCLYCTVTADDSNGNLYRQVFVRDDAGDAIRLDLVRSGALFVGDKIRVRLHGLYAVNANNMIYIDSVDIIRNTVKLSSGNKVTPSVTTLSALVLQSGNGLHPLQSKLITLSGVEFIPNSAMPTFADAISGTSADQGLTDCAGNQLTVSTSGYANFASKTLPTGNGQLTGIVTQYNDQLQFIIRSFRDVDMSGEPCSVTHPSVAPAVVYLKKDFNDNSLLSGNWSHISITASAVSWAVSTYSSNATPFAKVSGFVQGSSSNAECWLISPPVDLSGSRLPYLTFQTAAKYAGPTLEVLVSSDYTGGPPSGAQWQSLAGGYTLSPTGSGPGFVWTASGKCLLDGNKKAGLRIAFKYMSSSTDGASTYELDDIRIQED